jgi:hypothetical protein
MRRFVDYETVDRLIEDETLSLNEISRLAGCSSWSVRKRARELAGDPTPMKQPRASARAPNESEGEGIGIVGCLIFGAIGIGIIVLIVYGARHNPGNWPQQYPTEGPAQ